MAEAWLWRSDFAHEWASGAFYVHPIQYHLPLADMWGSDQDIVFIRVVPSLPSEPLCDFKPIFSNLTAILSPFSESL